MSDNLTVVINASQDAAEAIRQEIESQSGTQTRLSERRNLDGTTATWIIVAQLAVQALPHVLAIIKEFRTKVTKVTVAGIEIENPTQDDLRRLLTMAEAGPGRELRDG
jgi:hypothetical protein